MKIGKFTFGFRGWWALFRRNWYSTYRWRNIQELHSWRLKIIDIGAFYISKEV